MSPSLTAFAIGSMLAGLSSGVLAQQAPVDIRLEARISLGEVTGRIDHMAVDLTRHRLFVAELGNNSIGVVDVDRRSVAHVIRGLSEPQGVAYLQHAEALIVANGGDGSVRIFDAKGRDYREVKRINLKSDADNIRVDQAGARAFIGYGSGAVAVIDTGSLAKRAEIMLRGHPESFQLSPTTGRIFVNIPSAKEIAVIDSAAGKQIESWRVNHAQNFPMALDESSGRILVVFRDRPLLEAFSMRDGSTQASLPTCGDADDLFFDAKRRRVYISCGAGVMDVFETDGASFRHLAQVPTAAGARTSLYVPELDRLFVAAPARAGAPAAILVFTLG